MHQIGIPGIVSRWKFVHAAPISVISMAASFVNTATQKLNGVKRLGRHVVMIRITAPDRDKDHIAIRIISTIVHSF